ncbi:hypothetical protein WV31_12660 [Magnetospirillum sp. ME-1]|uniref:tyrosine-type recombinase/integrase n=1 Tax=Magnetospirillum sp. ME-1 TaxID=1639348 RepID=UPI000A17ED2C|nr:site-specific integrase [Magnetospirillum sp. ME-1]ARJ66458.1 hypothetical protein WV31_12660 [Magnetospirillum sp. ME-1]
MNDFSINLTRRVRHRKLADGTKVDQVRWVLNYKDPRSGGRKQEFFERQKDAQERRNELTVSIDAGAYTDRREVPTVAEAVIHWLADKKGKVKPNTYGAVEIVVAHIRGPVLLGTPEQRDKYRVTGKVPKGARLAKRLGTIKINDLTTAQIRGWHREVAEDAGIYTANRAKSALKAIMALAEEDFGVRAPSMPTGLGKTRNRTKKAILTPDQIATLIETAKTDLEHGIYYAFPFLAGTRPSEQLGLLWQEVDFDANVIRIRRILERDGALTEMTKTEAGTRDIPMSPTLRSMLLSWRARCPRKGGELHLVFPGPGRLQPWPKPRLGGGGPLLYQNFRRRYWEPAFKTLGLPYVTPHSARHAFISVLQAQGIEVGLVAKLAGHANATVTLGHYTQAVRGGEQAVAALDRAYAAR